MKTQNKHTHCRQSKLWKWFAACLFTLLATMGISTAKEVVYNLTIGEKTVNFTGKKVQAMSVNGSIPGPTLRFTVGDTAVIHVTNQLTTPSSIHWHGLLVPPSQDGVPYISFLPIKPGKTFTYRYKIRQSGTYWYHSHSGLQEQSGVYGSIVIQPKKKLVHSDKEHVVLLSDWTDTKPKKVMHLLRRGSEFMGVKKKTAQSLVGAIKTKKLGKFWKREAMRMPAMDLADVAYDAFLTNGKRNSTMVAKPGDTVRLRIIDGSASTFFHLQYAGGPLKIIAADGQNVEPVNLKTPLMIGVAETYDVIVKVPASGAYEFRATAQDGSGYTSLWIGSGEKHYAPDMPKPFVYDTMNMFGWKKMLALTPAGTMGMANPTKDTKMKMSGMDMSSTMKMGKEGKMNRDMNHGGMKMDHSKMNMSVTHPPKKWYDFLLREDASNAASLASGGMNSKERPFPPYRMLRSTNKTSFSLAAPTREVLLTLDGDMNRYVWSLNNQAIKPDNDIMIKQGEVVRFVFVNRTMMHHPMHLHGHFFRVINGQGDYSPLKHTVNVAPMQTTTIEFKANELGDWFFHCHLLYHMKSGMARVVRYEGYTASHEVEANAMERYHDPTYFFGQADLLSNMTQGNVRFENTSNILTLGWEAGWNGVKNTTWEAEFTYDRYINRFTSAFAGVYGEGVDGDLESERLIAGVRYLLPLNLLSTAWIDSDGEARISVGRELMLTPRIGIFGDVEYDTHEKWSYQGGMSYMINEHFSATGLWDSNYGAGAGLTIKF